MCRTGPAVTFQSLRAEVWAHHEKNITLSPLQKTGHIAIAQGDTQPRISDSLQVLRRLIRVTLSIMDRRHAAGFLADVSGLFRGFGSSGMVAQHRRLGPDDPVAIPVYPVAQGGIDEPGRNRKTLEQIKRAVVEDPINSDAAIRIGVGDCRGMSGYCLGQRLARG